MSYRTHIRLLAAILLLIGGANQAWARTNTSLPKTPEQWIVFILCAIGTFIWWKWPTKKK